MNESLLRALIKLFFVVVEPELKGLSTRAIGVIASFLEKDFSKDEVLEYINDIGSPINLNNSSEDISIAEDFLNQSIVRICGELNANFEQHQKVWLTLQLIEFVGDSGYISEKTIDLIEIVAREFNIPIEEFTNGKDFILAQNIDSIPNSPKLLVVSDEAPKFQTNAKYLYHRLKGTELFFLRIPSTNTILIKIFGENDFFLNSRLIKPNRAYIFGVGSVLRSNRIDPVYYSSIVGAFFQSSKRVAVRLLVQNLSYKYKGSNDGLHPFTFEAESGQLVGILGGSGVGKSTLINLLNGSLKPAEGSVIVNGYDIHLEKEHLKGVIGYVPQDDLLIEDLTVYQNLYFSAKFCFSNYTEDVINKVVEETMKDFDLFEAKDLKVGNPLMKFISGGQRKRLNIAMELLREPAILFVDEPTSGLSSFDSDRIVLILKKQTFKGKLVIVNIHQPSSDTFKLFDIIVVLDQGGRVIFQGNPMDAIVYFKHEGNYLRADESECQCCGNVNTEQILRVVEARVVNEYGKLTRKRKRPAKEWYELYKSKIENRIHFSQRIARTQLPENSFKIPNKWKQTWLFLRRNVLGKLTNQQFVTISLLEAPILALILSFFSKFISGTLNNPNDYIFSENENIPAYFFMSVIAALFMGLTMSAEEIIRDRKVRKRERFLNLSYFSYVNSKILLLIAYSAIQSFLFILVGNHVLEIQDSSIVSWLILFSVSVCANIIGLNISAAMSSVVAIYVTIPLIMIPMLLMSGVVVNYNKLHKYIMHPEYVPFIADIMPTRWAYEALCVEHFKNNRYNREFFEYEQKLSNNSFIATFLIPQLEIKLEESVRSIVNNKITAVTQNDLKLIQNEIRILSRDYPIDEKYFPDTSLLNLSTISINELNDFKAALRELKEQYLQLYRNALFEKEQHYKTLLSKLGSNESVYALKRRYHNNAVEELVLNKRELSKIVKTDNRLIRRYNLGYAIPTATNGRSHLFAPVKRIGNTYFDTLWLNILVLWFLSLFFYITLLTNIFHTLNTYLDQFKFRRLARRIARYIPH
jgi:ABC-type multidrug transport system ATPase subunit